MPHTPLVAKLKECLSVAAEASVREVAAEAVLERRADGLSRRNFLRKAGAIAASVAVGPVMAHAANKGSSARVAVVGAGLAGLTCAYRLRQRGLAAVVFEANDRLGGRCWTRRGDFAEGQIAEHGGELIDQSHAATRQLVQELGLDLNNLLRAESNGTEPFYFFDGQPYSYVDATNDLKGIWQAMHRDLSQASYPTLYNRYTQRGFELDQMSVAGWIEQTVPGGLESRLGQLLDVAYNIEYGGETDRQSSLNLLYLLGYSGPGQLRIFGPSNEKYHVRGGNDQIVERLAAPLNGQIRLGTALLAVQQTSSGAFAITVTDGRRTSTERFDKVVLALPFSILNSAVDLRRSGFRSLKLTAIRELAMGTNSKLALQFHDRHWRALGGNGESYSDRGYQATWEVSRGQGGSAGILVNYTGGSYGATFNNGTAADRAIDFLAQVEPVLPGLSAKWNGRVTLDYWPGNAFTRGSYSYWQVGQYTRFAGIEGEREGNCHFAGEHTSIDAQGYLEGAVESGERAAAEVLSDLS